MSFSPVLFFYRIATALMTPFAGLWLRRRARGGKEDASRLDERWGYYAQPRPQGVLVWLHAASVGESGVALSIAEAMAAQDPSLSFLLSTGTRTSAELVERRKSARMTHIYAPIDRRSAVRRFLAHWRPEVGVFVESELWPHLILGAEAAGVRLALVNARMSPRTLQRWRSWPKAGARLMRAFAFASAADARTGKAIAALRGESMHPPGNLKLAAPPPSIDAAARADFAAEIGARPVWLAASTHAGEDEIVLVAHALLRQRLPDALLVIAPRHPERGADVAALAGGAPRRALGQHASNAPVYVADTLGEMGLFYEAAPVALIGGSLLAHLKGHNPIEPAKLDAAILTGPYVESFEPVFAALMEAGGAREVRDGESIAQSVALLLSDEAARSAQTQAARAIVAQGAGAMTETLRAVTALLPQAAVERARAPA